MLICRYSKHSLLDFLFLLCYNWTMNLRKILERKMVVGFDPIYGPCWRDSFLWYAWSIGAHPDTFPKSEFSIDPSLSVWKALVINLKLFIVERVRPALRQN